MKITRAQKDAVISLLKERFDEQEKEAFLDFKAKNGAKIQKEFAHLIELRDRIEQIEKQCTAIKDEYDRSLEEFKKTNEPLKNYVYGSHYCVNGFKSKDEFIDALIRSKFEKPSRPNFVKVERQLELDTLSKDFDIEVFIQKYLN